ncbi:hypothetical protein SNE40_008500 [Patella caerulea]|uniref:PX domain-containing protein n=1 Tax=Patella caerulea TaxID=87958 RepID=A0AAN8QAF9_PATCE
MNAEEFLSLELNIDPIDRHLILDKMEDNTYIYEDESRDRRDVEEESDSPLVPKQLTSTPLKDNENDHDSPREFDPYNSDGDETGSNNASLYSSPSHQDIPTITITPESDPIEPDQLRVPILGHEVMESRSKFTIYKPKKKLFEIQRLKDKSAVVRPNTVKSPIVGYEIMEKRERSIVYKIEVERDGFDKWFVFRRYNDFYQLHEKLKELFPNFRLALPPRRWFRSNYDKDFLEERTLGLQAFLNNITGHRDICNSKYVRDFFCFDDPPGPHDSLEESRALCENLEETVYNLRKELSEKEEEMEILQEELGLYKNQVEILSRELREAKRDTTCTSKYVATSPGSNQLSLAECDQGGDSDQSASSDSHMTAADKSDTDDSKQDTVTPSTGIDRIPFKNKISVPIVSTDVYSS